MTGSNQRSPAPAVLRRRTVLLAGVTGVATAAGCLDVLPADDGPQEHAFDVTITTAGGDLRGSVAGAQVEDVVRVNAGDTVSFSFTNETDDPVGVHDHATDAEFVVDPGGTQPLEFEVTEAMIGRQEIEAWVADGTDGGGDHDAEHGADATAIVIVEVRPRGS